MKMPRRLQVRSRQIKISQRGNEPVQTEQPANLAAAFELLAGLSHDFFVHGRRQPRIDTRARV